MISEEMQRMIPQYLAGTLAAEDQRRLEACMDRDESLKSEVEKLQLLWADLGLLPHPQPSGALRAQFCQQLNAIVRAAPAPVRLAWWKRAFVPQIAVAGLIFAIGVTVGRQREPERPPATDIAQLRTQVEGLRETVALSLMDKQSAVSRLQGIAWSSQVDRPDHELLSALLATINQDPDVNVRLASLDALEKFTTDADVRKALEQAIPSQQSPLMQIALIDSLVHIRDNGAAKQLKQLSGDSDVNAAVRQRARWGLQKLNFE